VNIQPKTCSISIIKTSINIKQKKKTMKIMLIKLLIAVAIFYVRVRLSVAEKPVESSTRDGKFFGLFTGK
jgi:hypothetical protein